MMYASACRQMDIMSAGHMGFDLLQAYADMA